MNNILDKYLFQALDAYPYNLEETVECLNYALSYDEHNAIALGLLGQLHAEQLKDFETAKEYYQEALANDMFALGLYPKYINVLLWNEDYKEAENLIDFALTVKGTDKAVLHLKKAMLYEQMKEYKKALACLKQAKENAFNNHFINQLKEEKTRIKDKMPKPKKSKAKQKEAADTKKKNKNKKK